MQGFVAGVNAALKIRGEAPFDRCAVRDGYIGTLIDDLVTKGTERAVPYDDVAQRSTVCSTGRITPMSG